ncbi:MAG: hypothetical protein I3273_00045 [Candidatus Moeniiplasma glomeromycotorum]|nr:hypothetical protein [Candidatus Moeniiplasma glomeromycotorum]MCE8167479.1 hypothetical protein [Candidatus Moeniiplasma glomeromycotorum]MCE8168507.1 hypothetical protein [Candidatus Moeniiplasma glomeromycotorum]
MKSKEEILKELQKRKSLYKCFGWCKKKQKNHYCPRCLEVLWGWIILVLILVGVIIGLLIYIWMKSA